MINNHTIHWRKIVNVISLSFLWQTLKALNGVQLYCIFQYPAHRYAEY